MSLSGMRGSILKTARIIVCHYLDYGFGEGKGLVRPSTFDGYNSALYVGDIQARYCPNCGKRLKKKWFVANGKGKCGVCLS